MNLIPSEREMWAAAAEQVRREAADAEVMEIVNQGAKRAQSPVVTMEALRRVTVRLVLCTACYTLGAVFVVGYFWCLVSGHWWAAALLALLAGGVCAAGECGWRWRG